MSLENDEVYVAPDVRRCSDQQTNNLQMLQRVIKDEMASLEEQLEDMHQSMLLLDAVEKTSQWRWLHETFGQDSVTIGDFNSTSRILVMRVAHPAIWGHVQSSFKKVHGYVEWRAGKQLIRDGAIRLAVVPYDLTATWGGRHYEFKIGNQHGYRAVREFIKRLLNRCCPMQMVYDIVNDLLSLSCIPDHWRADTAEDMKNLQSIIKKAKIV